MIFPEEPVILYLVKVIYWHHYPISLKYGPAALRKAVCIRLMLPTLGTEGSSRPAVLSFYRDDDEDGNNLLNCPISNRGINLQHVSTLRKKDGMETAAHGSWEGRGRERGRPAPAGWPAPPPPSTGQHRGPHGDSGRLLHRGLGGDPTGTSPLQALAPPAPAPPRRVPEAGLARWTPRDIGCLANLTGKARALGVFTQPPAFVRAIHGMRPAHRSVRRRAPCAGDLSV